MVVSDGVCCKGEIFQGILAPTGFLPNIQSSFRRKVYVTGDYVHAPIQSNKPHIQTFSRSIYNTRRSKHPHLPVFGWIFSWILSRI